MGLKTTSFALLLTLVGGVHGARAQAPATTDAGPRLAGHWHVVNAASKQEGELTFRADGSYSIDGGQSEVAGSWLAKGEARWRDRSREGGGSGEVEPLAGGSYELVEGTILLLWYERPSSWTSPPEGALERSGGPTRVALVIVKGPDKLVVALQGHTHGVEVWTRTDSPGRGAGAADASSTP